MTEGVIAKARANVAKAGALFLLGFAISRLLLLAVVTLVRWLAESSISTGQIVGYELFSFGLCVAGGGLAIRLFGRRRGRQVLSTYDLTATRSTSHSIAVWFARLVVTAFFVTWVFGAPQVDSTLGQEAVERYKVLIARGGFTEWKSFPYVRTTLSIPVLPGIILSYHEYQVAGLAGWGGFTLHSWYPGHVHRLTERMMWIS